MLSLYAPTEGHARDVTGESTILLDRLLARRWDVLVEYVGDFPERGGPRQLLHFATELRVGKRQLQQFDFHYGVGLSSAAVNHFIGGGLLIPIRGIPSQLALSSFS
jgi:hypothetical protein